LPFLGSDRARMSIATIVTLHRAILDSIERRGYDLGRRPISLTMPQKLRALPEAWRIARNA
jgi:phytoene/squalene synthetase